jgi:predicted TPR repeat methyltransferase
MLPVSVVDTTEPNEQPTELTLTDALALAVHLHRSADLDQAETIYRRILDISPDHPDCLHFLGVLLHQRDQSDAAIELIQRSIILDPHHPDRYNNLGNVLLDRGDITGATAAYEKALALEPGHANAWNNLGALLRAQQRFEESEAAYQKAIELAPDHVDAHTNYGNLLSSRGRIKEAVACYCKAITLAPDHAESKKMLGIAYYTLGQIDAAAEVFRHWLEEEPDSPVAQHLFAACSGQNVPARASDAYIESTFDGFAASFDAKLERLAYRAPNLIAEALAKACASPARELETLDAGCGTGLCGPLIAPWTRRLTGVDLSSRMMAAARNRGVYDDLVKAELTAYLRGHCEAFDLIVSADTLVYFGALEPALEAAFSALRRGGLLLFTVEEAEQDGVVDDHRINPHGRYSHSRAYVERTLSAAGFSVPAIEPAVLRKEGGKPVDGLVVTARRERGDGN